MYGNVAQHIREGQVGEVHFATSLTGTGGFMIGKEAPSRWKWGIKQ